MSTGFKGPVVHGPQSTHEGYKYRNGMGMMSSAEFNVLHEDFDGIFTTNAIPGWAAIIDTGCTNVINTTDATGANGVMSMTSDTTSEGSALYSAKAFQFTAGKRMFIEARVQLNEVTDNEFYIGFSSADDVTNPEDLWDASAADFAVFGIADGSAATVLKYEAGNDDTITTDTGTISLTAATWATIALFYDGGSVATIHGFVNGVPSVTSTTTAEIPVGKAMVAFVGHLNGNGSGTDTAFVDYIRVVSER